MTNTPMENDQSDEIARRETIAREAFNDPNLTKKESHDGLAYYIDHCLTDVEDEAEFWISLIGKAKPNPADIINLLVLKSVWSTDDAGTKNDKFDFWIDDYTDYVVCVTFNNKGEIISVDMES